MIYAAPGTTENSFLDSAPTGLAGTLKWKLLTATGSVEIAEVTGTGISEIEPTVYRKSFTVPSTQGDFLVVWTNGSTRITEELVVTYSSPSPSTPGTDTPYFTVAEFRAKYADDTAVAAKSDGAIEAARSLAETSWEAECEVAFVPRTETERVNGNDGPALILKWPRIRAITSITADGTALTSDQLALVQYGSTSVIGYNRYGGWFCAGNGNVTVVYEHGYDSPEEDVKDAVMVLARDLLIQGPVSDRRTALPSESSGPITLARPGIDSRHPFGIDYVDSVFQRRNERSYV